MKKTSAILLAIATLSLAFWSCNKDKPVTIPVDEKAPTITMTSPIVVPEGQYIPLSTSDSIIVDIRFEDDFELSNYEVTINPRFDLNFFKTTNFPWRETIYGSLEGTVGGFNRIIYVVYDPDAGPYEFRVKVWDKEGRLTEKVTYFYITNPIDPNKPNVSTSVPTSNVDTFAIGTTIPITATIYDGGNDVRDVYARVRNAFTKEILEGSYIFLDTLFVPTFVLDTFVNIPAGTVPGDYWVEVYGGDDIRNIGMDTTRIYIRN